MDSPMPKTIFGTLGTLTLVAKQDGRDLQSFPIDSERVTFGRDYECDIRLYFADVSKFHCEVIFDLLTDKASLHVHGSNGVYFTPKDGEIIFLKASSVKQLSTGDRFIIRKKIFRFDYGSMETHTPLDTPLKPSSSSMTPSRQARRRSSHRLSLVPVGKTFKPHTPVKSGLANMETAEEEEELVNIVEGDEGDKVYVEVKEDIVEAHSSTPQPENDMETPSPAPSTPTPAAGRSARLSLQLAHTTPKGPASLRKNILLKSARKVWHETVSPGVEGAIEQGNVQVRRRSGSRHSKSPVHSPREVVVDEEDMQYLVIDGESDAELESRMQEDLKEEYTEESDGKVLEAAETAQELVGENAGKDIEEDMAEDIEEDVFMAQCQVERIEINEPQQGIEVEDELEETELEESGDEKPTAMDGGLMDDGNGGIDKELKTEADVDDGMDIQDEENEDTGLDAAESVSPETPTLIGEQDCAPDEPDDVYSSSSPALPGTPAAARVLNQFYTPQARAAPRAFRPLGTVGPAVRFKPGPAQKMEFKPFHLIKPIEVEPKEEAEKELVHIVATPGRRAMREEAKRHRQSIVTPRALPVPVPGSFRRAQLQSTPLSRLEHFHTPLKPQTSTKMESTEALGNETPVQSIRRRLEELQKSVSKPLVEPKPFQRMRRTGTAPVMLSSPISRASTEEYEEQYEEQQQEQHDEHHDEQRMEHHVAQHEEYHDEQHEELEHHEQHEQHEEYALHAQHGECEEPAFATSVSQLKRATPEPSESETEEASILVEVKTSRRKVATKTATKGSKPAKKAPNTTKAVPIKSTEEKVSAPSRSRAKKVKEEKENAPEEPVVKRTSRRAAAIKATEALAETSVSSRSTRSRR